MDIFNYNNDIFLACTYLCNANCKKCITRHSVHKGKSMDRMVVDAFLEKLRAADYKGRVNLGTGEPLLYEHIEYLLQGILSVNDKINVRLLTNGMALDDAPKIIGDPRIKIGVTLDGMTQDSLKSVQTGVHIGDVKLNIVKVSKLFGGDHLYLNFTLYHDNEHEIMGFCEFARICSIKEVYITPVKVFRGFEKDLIYHEVQESKALSACIEEAKTYLLENGINPSGIDIFKKHHRYSCFLKHHAGPIIDVDGQVTFCSGHEDSFIGSIFDDDISDKWDKFARSIDIKKWCGKCLSNPDENGIFALPTTIMKG